jgi:D-lactate dehydrogenase
VNSGYKPVGQKHDREKHPRGEPSFHKSREIFDRLAAASDASHFYMVPASVVDIRHKNSVSEYLKKASDRKENVTFRSGGTSLSGQSSSEATIINSRKSFRRIRALDGGERVQVQSGATLARVNAQLRRFGRRLGPDPASEIACTIGGIVANNSSGMRCGTAENSYSTLRSMVFTLPSGTTVDTSLDEADSLLRKQEPAIWQGLCDLKEEILQDEKTVDHIRSQFRLKNTMGYQLQAFLDFQRPIDILSHLLVGSEGTLGFVSEATFDTVPLAEYSGTCIAVFQTLTEAAAVVPDAVAKGAVAIELVDTTSLRVGQGMGDVPDEISQLALENEAGLIIELEADSYEALESRQRSLEKLLSGAGAYSNLAFTNDASKQSKIWAFRKGLYAAVAGSRPSGTMALLEDVVVPRENLAETCHLLQELFQHHGYPAPVIFGHAKDGNIHFMLTDDFGRDGAMNNFRRFTDDLVRLILNQGGNLKAEHGAGRAMAPFVEQQFGSYLYSLMWRVKTLVDPERILNPDVILTQNSRAHLENFKVFPKIEPEVDACVECGYCEPVCPSEDLTLSPRQRISLRRAMERARAAGDTGLLEELERKYTYYGVETCAVDGMCQQACPVNINTGDLVKRIRQEESGPRRSAFWKYAARHWGPLTGLAAFSLSVGKLLPTSLIEWITKRLRTLFGADEVPLYSGDLPQGGRRRRTKHGRIGAVSGPPVAVYFPSCTSRIFSGGSSQAGVNGALATLLQHAHASMRVPENIDKLCCGTPWASKGLSAGYEIMREQVVQSVIKLAREEGVPVVVDSSSCTDGLVNLLQSSDVEVEELTSFVLRELAPKITPARRFKRVMLHPTCASERHSTTNHLSALASMVAEEVCVPPVWKCCGFAGDRGMLHPELTKSATAGEAEYVGAGEADCYISNNRTCELALSRATGRQYRHVVEALADAL